MILLDTNVISEVTKIGANQVVLSYVNGLAPETIFTAAICEAEIRYGLLLLPAGRRRELLIAQMAAFFDIALRDQVLRFGYRPGSLAPNGPATVVVSGLPTGGHTAKTLALGKDGSSLRIALITLTKSSFRVRSWESGVSPVSSS